MHLYFMYSIGMNYLILNNTLLKPLFNTSKKETNYKKEVIKNYLIKCITDNK